MAGIKNLMVDIQNDIIAGILSFGAIAEKHHVPMSWVNEAWDALCEQENEEAARIARIDEELLYGDRD